MTAVHAPVHLTVYTWKQTKHFKIDVGGKKMSRVTPFFVCFTRIIHMFETNKKKEILNNRKYNKSSTIEFLKLEVILPAMESSVEGLREQKGQRTEPVHWKLAQGTQSLKKKTQILLWGYNERSKRYVSNVLKGKGEEGKTTK